MIFNPGKTFENCFDLKDQISLDQIDKFSFFVMVFYSLFLGDEADPVTKIVLAG